MSLNVSEEQFSELEEEVKELSDRLGNLEETVQGKPGNWKSVSESLQGIVNNMQTTMQKMKEDRDSSRKTVWQLTTGAIGTLIALVLGFIFARVTGGG